MHWKEAERYLLCNTRYLLLDGGFMDYLSFSFFLFATLRFSIMSVYYFHSKNKGKLL